MKSTLVCLVLAPQGQKEGASPRRVTPGRSPGAAGNPCVVWICIDPGHGGDGDKGARALSGGFEKDHNLAVCLPLAEELRRAGFKVVMTREDDRYVSLVERVVIGNGCDVFISIHSNSTPQRPGKASGYEIYYFAALHSSAELASTLAGYLDKNIDLPFRGVKKARFYVLRKSTCPAVLLELGFLNNAHDEAILADPECRRIIAACIASRLSDYLALLGKRRKGKWARYETAPSPALSPSAR